MTSQKYKNMIKKFMLSLLCASLSLPVFAFEDALIMANGKLTDIKIEHNDIIDVFPMITLMNDKNTLIVHPLKTGNSRFIIKKDGKTDYVFEVNVTEDKTTVKGGEEFEILTIDCPPYDYENYIDTEKLIKPDAIDAPPALRGEY